MTQTILDYGNTEQERVRIGLLAELRFDFSNKSLRIHDAVTQGGFEILPRQILDNIYQGISAELTALAGLEDDVQGYLVRTGPGQYRDAAFESSDNISVTNAKGISGNTSFTLKPVITTSHEFTQEITATGGVAGNVTGNLTGDVTGNVEGDLTGDSTGTHTGPTIGAVDARGETIQIDDAALSIAKVSGLQAALDAIVTNPIGLVAMWSGSAASIPAGWSLCDGTNSTPNLVGKFVYGSDDDTIAAGAGGGAATHTHTVTAADAGNHQHAITVSGHALTIQEMPAHDHGNGITDRAGTSNIFNHGQRAANPSTPDSVDDNSASGVTEGNTTTDGGGATHSHGATSDSVGTHTHAISADPANNLPPYFALCYIMYTG